jgi:hypothetical protein
MLTLEKPNVILWEAESVIKNVVIKDEELIQQIEKFMQDEPFYGDPDFSYY